MPGVGARVTFRSDINGAGSYDFQDCLRAATRLQYRTGWEHPISIAFRDDFVNGIYFLRADIAWRNEVFASIDHHLSPQGDGAILWEYLYPHRMKLFAGSNLAPGELIEELFRLLKKHAEDIIQKKKVGARRRSAAESLLSCL